MIATAIVLAACLFFFYQFQKGKKKFNLYIAIYLALFILCLWPIYLSSEFSLAAIAFFSAILQYLDYKKVKGKDKNKNLIVYAVVSAFFGLVFLINLLFVVRS